MIVTKDTKISELLSEKPESIDVIASINKHFLKLKNPILRKMLASRVTVKEASKIGKINVNDFLNKIESIGFKVQYVSDELSNNNKVEHENMSLNEITLDVRPTIESGADPFKEIMQKIKQLKENQTLKIINVFEPVPLIKIIKEKGFKTWTNMISEDEYHTFFTKNTTTPTKEILEDLPISLGGFDEMLATFGSNLKEIEVRHLEMPEPMVTILDELTKLPNNFALLVNHKKVPQFLLPELKARNFKWMSKNVDLGHTLLLIYKDK